MHTARTDPEPPVTLDRRTGPHGEVVLRQRGEVAEIIANGCFLMDSADGRSERLLVRAALAELDAAATPRPKLLLGGLGVGFSLAEAASEPRWARITTVEREPAILAWHTTGERPLGEVTREALEDSRVELVEADLLDFLAGTHATAADTAALPSYDVLCLDIDNGPDWTVTDGNRSLYSPTGLARCRARLHPGGVLAVWSAQPSTEFEEALRNAGFDRVRTDEVPVARGVPDVVHFGRRA